MRRLNPRESRIAGWTAIVLAGAALYLGYFEPALLRHAQLCDEVAQWQLHLTRMQANMQLRDRIEHQYAAARNAIRESGSPSQEMARFARLLSDLYTPLAVQVTAVRPLPDVHEQYYAKFALRLELTGAVADVGGFLAAMAQLAEPVRVEWIELTCKDRPGLVSACLIVTRIAASTQPAPLADARVSPRRAAPSPASEVLP